MNARELYETHCRCIRRTVLCRMWDHLQPDEQALWQDFAEAVAMGDTTRQETYNGVYGDDLAEAGTSSNGD